MRGVDATNGKPLSGEAHLRQSVRDILTTPLGSRVMRRDYGSRVMRLVDSPGNQATTLEIVSATVEALDKWEPRIKVKNVVVNPATSNGKMSVSIYGVLTETGDSIAIEDINL